MQACSVSGRGVFQEQMEHMNVQCAGELLLGAERRQCLTGWYSKITNYNCRMEMAIGMQGADTGFVWQQRGGGGGKEGIPLGGVTPNVQEECTHPRV